MRCVKILFFFFLALPFVSAMGKQPKDKNKYGVYLAGVSASFTDSLVYFTDVQYVDSAAVDGHGMLVARSAYSYQLKDFLEREEGGKNRTCFIFFNRKKKNLQKEIGKLREKYQKGGLSVLLDVNPNFKFEKPDWE